MAKKNNEKTFLEKIKCSFSKMLLGNIVLVGIFLIYGLIAYLNPYSMSMKAAEVYLGIFLVLFGVFYLYEFLMKSEIKLFKYKVISGVTSLLLGVFVMINPFKTFGVITTILGIYLSICALLKVIVAFKFKKLKFDGWKILMVMSFILLIFGVFMGINPMKRLDYVQAAGMFIILSCILEVCVLLILYTRGKDIKELLKKDI